MADALPRAVNVVPHTTASPRLLNSVAPEAAPARDTQPADASRLTRSTLGLSNGVAIFVGFFVAAGLMAAGAFVLRNHPREQEQAPATPRLVNIATQSVSVPAHPETSPSPIIVHLTQDLFHVTAISLGHPRLAVINGQQVGEGDRLTVHAPTRAVAVNLRVTKIGDGRIELSYGQEAITVRLSSPRTK